jgi:hypothetical protein
MSKQFSICFGSILNAFEWRGRSREFVAKDRGDLFTSLRRCCGNASTLLNVACDPFSYLERFNVEFEFWFGEINGTFSGTFSDVCK